MREHLTRQFATEGEAWEGVARAFTSFAKQHPAITGRAFRDVGARQHEWLRLTALAPPEVAWIVDFTVLGRIARGEPIEDGADSLDAWLAAIGRGEADDAAPREPAKADLLTRRKRAPRRKAALASTVDWAEIIACAFRDTLNSVKCSLGTRHVRKTFAGIIWRIRDQFEAEWGVPLTELLNISHDLHWPDEESNDPCACGPEAIPPRAYKSLRRQFTECKAARMMGSSAGRQSVAQLLDASAGEFSSNATGSYVNVGPLVRAAIELRRAP